MVAPGHFMSNGERILRCLDAYLTKPVELVLYGRAAIALGFDSPQLEHLSTMDVDVIVSMRALEQLQNNEDFWDALASANAAIEKEGLYLTHIFTEEDVIIRDGWESRRVPINLDCKNIKLYRPSAEDLILTKMMRNDVQDLADIEFMLTREPAILHNLEQCIGEAKVPPVPEIQEHFRLMRPKVLQIVNDMLQRQKSDLPEI